MARRRGQSRHDAEFDDGPQEADLERFGGVTTSCKSCGAELYDDVEICWKCGKAVGGSDATAMPPKWVVVTGLVIVVAFLWLMFGR